MLGRSHVHTNAASVPRCPLTAHPLGLTRQTRWYVRSWGAPTDPFPQALSDRIIGGTFLFVAGFVFTYYTLWALVTVRGDINIAGSLTEAAVFPGRCSHPGVLPAACVGCPSPSDPASTGPGRDRSVHCQCGPAAGYCRQGEGGTERRVTLQALAGVRTRPAVRTCCTV